MTEDEARNIIKEQIRRHLKVERQPLAEVERSFAYIDDLFPEQRASVDDRAKFSARLCSRRAGKTHAIAARQIRVCQTRRGAICPYIGLTRDSAERIYWPKLEEFKDCYRLNMRLEPGKLRVRFPDTGSMIFLVGADKEREINKLRGQAYDDVQIDEGQSFGEHLTPLVEEVLEPTLLDRDGAIGISGTPNAACIGYFHDITTGKKEGYKVHSWTVLQNAFIPKAAAWLEAYRIKKGWTLDHPVYQREWRGQWVRDIMSLVYRYNEAKNYLPDDSTIRNRKDLTHTMGIDLGTKDAFTIGIWASTDSGKEIYARDCYKQSGLFISDMAGIIRRFIDKYQPTDIEADTGGLGKAIIEEMNMRYGFNINAAEKTAKRDVIELMNSDLEAGYIKIIGSTCEPYINEIKILQWDEERKKEDDRYQNDACDGFLYGYRKLKHWGYQKPEKLPSRDEEAWVDKYWEEKANELAQPKEWWEQ